MAPAAIEPTILNKPLKAMESAPSDATELQTILIKLRGIIGLLASEIKAGKCAVIKAS